MTHKMGRYGFINQCLLLVFCYMNVMYGNKAILDLNLFKRTTSNPPAIVNETQFRRTTSEQRIQTIRHNNETAEEMTTGMSKKVDKIRTKVGNSVSEVLPVISSNFADAYVVLKAACNIPYKFSNFHCNVNASDGNFGLQ